MKFWNFDCWSPVTDHVTMSLGAAIDSKHELNTTPKKMAQLPLSSSSQCKRQDHDFTSSIITEIYQLS